LAARSLAVDVWGKHVPVAPCRTIAGEHLFAMKQFRDALFRSPLFVSLLYGIVRFYLSLCRVSVANEQVLLGHLDGGSKVIAAIWHQRFFGLIGYAKKFAVYAPSVMISRSADGEMIAQIALRLGFRPVRGSSSRGGRRALLSIVDDLARNPAAVHAVDGPRGPRCVVKSGLIKMAQLSGAAIFPVYVSMDRAWCCNSWDRFLIPKPFSRIFLVWGDPIFVPREMDSDAFETVRLDVEQKMRAGYRAVDQRMGWKDPL